MFKDRAYYSTLIKIGLPISLMQLVSASMSIIDVIMVGQLGEIPIAGVGLANQLYNIFSLVLLGIASGTAIFTAQYWGKGDMRRIRQALGLCLSVALAAALIFTLLAVAFPQLVMRVFTEDPTVIDAGSQYLRIVGFSFLLSALSYCHMAVLRSTQKVRMPMFITAASLCVNTLLNYLLILGKLGFPALGVQGAALATLIARGLEAAAMLSFAYGTATPLSGGVRDILSFDGEYSRRFFRTTLPVVFNETIWSVGISAYSAIYARISTDAAAATNIANTIDKLAFVAFMGVGYSCAVMVGNTIGAGDKEKAYVYAKRSLLLSILMGLVVGAIMIAVGKPMISLYKIAPSTAHDTFLCLMIIMVCLWARSANVTMFLGILRAGGDTRYALLLEMCTQWLVGISLALVAAFVLHWPVYWVMAMSMTDDVLKLLIAFWRFRSRRWVHFLAH